VSYRTAREKIASKKSGPPRTPVFPIRGEPMGGGGGAPCIPICPLNWGGSGLGKTQTQIQVKRKDATAIKPCQVIRRRYPATYKALANTTKMHRNGVSKFVLNPGRAGKKKTVGFPSDRDPGCRGTESHSKVVQGPPDWSTVIPGTQALPGGMHEKAPQDKKRAAWGGHLDSQKKKWGESLAFKRPRDQINTNKGVL